MSRKKTTKMETSALKDGLTYGITRDAYHKLKKVDGLTFSSTGFVAEIFESCGGGTSVFDPVLCELMYKWFCPKSGVVLDPFAGGSVRGVIASLLGRRYIGVELRREQVEANIKQAESICGACMPKWHTGDSRNVDIIAEGIEFDFLFSCPPYADLEVYSDDPQDLSTLAYNDFVQAYREIIYKSVSLLKDNTFACFVVGEVRDKKGFYYGFVPDTIKIFQDAGLKYYNEAILVTQAGSLPVRAGKAFETTRKLGKTHQNILIFCKGDPRKATALIGNIEPESQKE